MFNNYEKGDSHFYKNSVVELYQYHLRVTSNTLLSLDSYITMVVEQFVPPEFHGGLNKKQKYVILHEVLSQSLAQYISSVISESEKIFKEKEGLIYL